MMNTFCHKYLEILASDYPNLNLTRILAPTDLYNKQVLDSILPAKESKSFQNAINSKIPIIDIGFGGGFPILPLAVEYPDVRFIGFEAREKKVLAVRDMATKLNIKNVSLFHYRFEDVFFDRESFITFKAIGEIKDILMKIKTNRRLDIFFYKGPNVVEKENPKNKIAEWELAEKNEIKIPETLGRITLCYKNVPRGTKSMNQKLVKLSNIL
ncbi:MAG: RsmG family class I SAM-dependent methyltransferase [Pseudomonadota bacterium]